MGLFECNAINSNEFHRNVQQQYMTALSSGSAGTWTATADPSVKSHILRILSPTLNEDQYLPLPLPFK
jgi:hypothetical protein